MKVKQHLPELLDKELITPSQSSHAFPIVLVKKKNGALCMCVDYCLLSAKARLDAYPLLRIDESLDIIIRRS